MCSAGHWARQLSQLCKMAASHTRVLGFGFWLWLLSPLSCQVGPWPEWLSPYTHRTGPAWVRSSWLWRLRRPINYRLLGRKLVDGSIVSCSLCLSHKANTTKRRQKFVCVGQGGCLLWCQKYMISKCSFFHSTHFSILFLRSPYGLIFTNFWIFLSFIWKCLCLSTNSLDAGFRNAYSLAKRGQKWFQLS